MVESVAKFENGYTSSCVSGHIAAACLSLHPESAGLLQLTSLRTAVVDYRSSPVRAERRCMARSGLVATRPRQFCTPDIALAAHSLQDTVEDCATHVQCTRWPVSGVHKDIVAPVASNPGRQQLRFAARSDVIVPRCRTKFGSVNIVCPDVCLLGCLSIAGPEVWNSLPQSVRSGDTVRQFRRLLKTHYFQLHFGPN